MANIPLSQKNPKIFSFRLVLIFKKEVYLHDEVGIHSVLPFFQEE